MFWLKSRSSTSSTTTAPTAATKTTRSLCWVRARARLNRRKTLHQKARARARTQVTEGPPPHEALRPAPGRRVDTGNTGRLPRLQWQSCAAWLQHVLCTETWSKIMNGSSPNGLFTSHFCLRRSWVSIFLP